MRDPSNGHAITSDAPELTVEAFAAMPPADAANELAALPAAEAARAAERLDPAAAAAILSEMHAADAGPVVTAMRPTEASDVLAAMDPDDRVDVLGELPRPAHDLLLGRMNSADQAEVRRLEEYPPDTAGGIMSPEVAALPASLAVEQAVAELRRLSGELEQVFYLYTVDGSGRLSGVLSVRDLILAEPGTLLSQVARREVLSVPPDMDQEQVARRVLKYGYLALPVVDADRRLLGVVTVDDVLDVLQEEATEDLQRMVGAGPEERLTSPWHYSFKRRIPWLGVNLVTAFVAASVVGLFEGTIEEAAVLAVYMPVVAGMGGNASAQAMAVTIRGIALGEVGGGVALRLFRRELIVGSLSGLCVGVAAGIVAAILHSEYWPALGVVAGTALLVNHTFACVWGVAVPLVMRRLGFDPAQSATIFTTTLTDMVGFFTLLGLAAIGMSWLK